MVTDRANITIVIIMKVMYRFSISICLHLTVAHSKGLGQVKVKHIATANIRK